MNPQKGFPTPSVPSPKSGELAEALPLCVDLTNEPPCKKEDVDDDDVKCLSSPAVEENEELSEAYSSSPDSSGFSEEESDSNSDVITISDDDEDLKKIDPTKMKCHRCPLKKQTFWKDPKRFLVHIKRHVVADHFGCILCHKPFIKLGQCLKHERNCDGEGASEDDLGNDLRKSTSLYKYRGPEVASVLESYAVQLSGKLTRKAAKTNKVAKFAVKAHKENDKLKWVEYKLGKFRGRGDQREAAKKPVKRCTRKAISGLGKIANENSVDGEANGA